MVRCPLAPALLPLVLSALLFLPSLARAAGPSPAPEPAFGSYVVPADGQLYALPLQGIHDVELWARYSGGVDGELLVDVTHGDGRRLARATVNELWRFPGLEDRAAARLEVVRPLSGSRAVMEIQIEHLAPARFVRFGLYRPDQIQDDATTLADALGRDRLAGDFSEDLHPYRCPPQENTLPARSRIQGVNDWLSPFVQVVDGSGEDGFTLAADALRWGGDRFELRRCWDSGRRGRHRPSWGYVVVDHGQRRWWRLVAFRSLGERDEQPAAWLFPDGMLVVGNGAATTLRAFRLSDEGVFAFAIPTKDVQGHLKATARLTGRPGLDGAARIRVVGARATGRHLMDLDLDCLLVLPDGRDHTITYRVVNGRLVSASTTIVDPHVGEAAAGR